MLIKTISLIMLISNTDKILIKSKIKLLQLYCLLQSFIIKTLSFAVWSFKGGDLPRLFNTYPSKYWGLIQTPTLFLGGAHPHVLTVNSGFLLSLIHHF